MHVDSGNPYDNNKESPSNTSNGVQLGDLSNLKEDGSSLILQKGSINPVFLISDTKDEMNLNLRILKAPSLGFEQIWKRFWNFHYRPIRA